MISFVPMEHELTRDIIKQTGWLKSGKSPKFA